MILATVLSGMLVAPSKAQEGITEYIALLMKKYPDAAQRIEYRCKPVGNTQKTVEIRHDFRFKRNAMLDTEVDRLVRLYEEAWNHADPSTDKCMKYAYKDSICSTIVYNAEKNAKSELLNPKNASAFWDNDGYLLFDMGTNVSVIANTTTCEKGFVSTADFSSIEQTFRNLSYGRSVDSVKVRYTGTNGSFCFQRGSGKGWTKGTRYTLKNVAKTDFKRIKEAFVSFFGSNKAVNLIAYNQTVMLKDEAGNNFFIASFSKDHSLNFMHATFEDEICVPSSWETTDFFDNGNTRHADTSRLDSIYEDLSQGSGASATEVKYTGSFNHECHSFVWQRGWGKGRTKGTRIESVHIGKEDSARIRNIFRSYRNVTGHVSVKPDMIATYEDGTRTFYGYATDKHGKDYFIKATAEEEICIPADWTTRDYFKGSEPGAIDRADNRTKRMLGLSRLWADVKYNFAFMDRLPTDWDSLYVEMIPQMAVAENDREAVLLLKQMIAQVHDGHTFVAGEDGTPFPMETKLIGGKVYVDKVLSSELAKQGVRRGIELTAIDNKDVTAYAKEHIEPYVASSTEQWLRHVTYEGFGLTRRNYGDSIALDFKDGEYRFKIKTTVGEHQWDLSGENDIMEFSVLKKNIGYLKISTFNDPKLKEAFDDCYPRLLNTQALIIDLRGNEGGHSNNADYILRHLSADSIKTNSWKSPKHIPAFKAWGYGTMWHEQASGYMQPIEDKQIYDKPVVVLIDNGTFSAAEDFCGVFRGMKRGILIGLPTGGSTGNGIRIPLIPDTKTWANICSKHDTAADGTEFVGCGFIPDIQVEEDYQSYFIDKTDRGILTAINLISKSL